MGGSLGETVLAWLPDTFSGVVSFSVNSVLSVGFLGSAGSLCSIGEESWDEVL